MYYLQGAVYWDFLYTLMKIIISDGFTLEQTPNCVPATNHAHTNMLGWEH